MNIKKVFKPWGYELWIAEGIETPYATKKIFFNSGNRTSLQVHERKIETNFVLKGTGKLFISKNPFDIELFLSNGMTQEEIEVYQSEMEIINLFENVVVTVPPKFVHRVVADTDLEFIETSSIELDDVIRIQDDNGRSHGKIPNEHV